MNTDTFNKIYKRVNERVHSLVFKSSYRKTDLKLSLWQRYLIMKSIIDFKRCLKQYPKHWPSMFLLGKIYQRLGRFDLALTLFESAYTIEKNNIDVLREASLSSLHVDNIEKAIFYSDNSLKLKPNDITLLGNHAMNLLIANRDIEAKEFIKKAIDIDSDNIINNDIKMVIDSVISGNMKRMTCKDTVK